MIPPCSPRQAVSRSASYATRTVRPGSSLPVTCWANDLSNVMVAAASTAWTSGSEFPESSLDVDPQAKQKAERAAKRSVERRCVFTSLGLAHIVGWSSTFDHL